MRKATVIVRTLATLSGFGLASCATVGSSPNGRPVALESETIRYETAPCFGTCPVYAVTIMPDGNGTFEGKRFTAVVGTRAFRVAPAAYRAFAARLAPYRPADNEKLYQPGMPDCPNPPSDMPSVDIVWSEASGGRQHLNVYYGCGAQSMREALRVAPDILPIAAFIAADHAK